jgi:hypothetical protein
MTTKKAAPSTNNNKQQTNNSNNNNDNNDNILQQCRSNGFTVDKNNNIDINARRSIILYCTHRHGGYGCNGLRNFKKLKNKWTLTKKKEHRKNCPIYKQQQTTNK